METINHDGILDPINDVVEAIHIIGCGALGSNMAVSLARLGIDHIVLHDFDKVEAHNVTNQAFTSTQIGMLKTDALSALLKEINPSIKIVTKGKYVAQALAGYVFLCLDNIETRAAIVETNKYRSNIKMMFDLRMGLYTAQYYATEWHRDAIATFASTMAFTQEEAMKNTPMSPCGTTLSVMPTIQTIVAIATINFIKICRGLKYAKIVVADIYENSIAVIA